MRAEMEGEIGRINKSFFFFFLNRDGEHKRMSEQSISEQRNKTPIRACRSKGGADKRGGTAAVTN